MKKLLFIISLFIGFASQGQVKVLGYMMPNNPADRYATHIDTFGAGGLMTMTTVAQRNAIPAQRRREGMLVYVADSVKFFQLGADLVTWTPFVTSPSTTYVETDPAFYAHVASSITAGDIARWNEEFTFDTLKIYFLKRDFGGEGTRENPLVINRETFYDRFQVDSAIAANKAEMDSNMIALFEMATDDSAYRRVESLGGAGFVLVSKLARDTVEFVGVDEGSGGTGGGTADGSETKVTAGTNVTVTGTGTTASPYVINSTGGGGTSEVKQTYTSGAAVTISNTTTWLVVNPASTVATLSVTTPAAPTDMQTIRISFGGTVTTGAVITTLTMVANTGQSILQASTPTTVEAGETIAYRYNSTNQIWYRLQ